MPDLYIGLMSGTSADGVDAALVRIDEHDIALIETHQLDYAESVRKTILTLLQGNSLPFEQVAELDQIIGDHFAKTCLTLLSKANINAKTVCAIGSHGQTIRHCPNAWTATALNPGRLD